MNPSLTIEIAAEETSSPLQGCRYVKPFSNFFQAAKLRFAHLDPDSGVHLVGPMFELTACIDNEKNLQDFDAIYPETGVTFGPTICSFGLSYNDHNYALPVGLTPPTMAPHLMDVNFPPRKPKVITLPFDIARESAGNNPGTIGDENIQVSSASTASQAKFLIKTKGVKTSAITTTSASTSLSDMTSHLSFSSNSDPTAGLSDSKKTLFAAWHAKAAATGGTLLVQQRWKVPDSPSQTTSQSQKNPTEAETSSEQDLTKEQIMLNVPRYCRDIGKESEGERVYLESDMKSKAPEDEQVTFTTVLEILEVPEELCVSPSKLSSLDSSDEDDLSGGMANTPDHTSGPSAADLGPKPAMWSTVSCVCDIKVGDSRMLQCLNCRLLQHMDCMAIVYAEGASTDEANPNVITPREKLLDPSIYLCPSCIRPVFTIRPEVLERVLSAQKERESVKQANILSLIQHHTGKSDAFKHPIGGAQLLASATDRARQLGLIGSGSGTGSTSSSKSVTFPSTDERHKMNCIQRQNNETTDINRRIPSPPRASKRKQDLTSKSYVEIPSPSTKPGVLGNEEKSANAPSASTVGSGPNTPAGSNASLHLSYHHNTKIDSADVADERSPSISSVLASTEKTPMTSPMSISNSAKKRSSFYSESPLRLSTGKRGLAVGSTLSSAWAKDYREADVSIYSENLLNYVAQRISSGRERVQRLPPTSLGRTPLCRVVMFDHNDKGLEASARLGKGEVVTEIRGNLMLLEEYEHFVDPINEYNRYVMIYQNFGDRAIAINTSQYGNDARFIRRSCIPNCFLDHYVVFSKLRIIIRTTQELMPGVELTIPFDFDYRSCRYAVKCACARSRCPVQKWCRKLVRNKVMPYLDYGKFIESRLNALSKPITEEQSPSTPVGSRSYSTDNSPVPTSTQKTIMGAVSTPTSSTQRYTPSASIKRPFPAARLFTSPIARVAPSPSLSSTINKPVVTKPIVTTTGDVETPKSTALTKPVTETAREAEPTESKSEIDNPPTDQPVPSKIRRSGGSKEPGVQKEADPQMPPFEPIIMTRRQLAKAAASQAVSTRSSEGSGPESEYNALRNSSLSEKTILGKLRGKCRFHYLTMDQRRNAEVAAEKKKLEKDVAERISGQPCKLPGTYDARIGAFMPPDWRPREQQDEADLQIKKNTPWERTMGTDLPKPKPWCARDCNTEEEQCS
ncbi:hypothetical protein Aperf_G00000074138 [Anoplocephala perfoliata]